MSLSQAGLEGEGSVGGSNWRALLVAPDHQGWHRGLERTSGLGELFAVTPRFHTGGWRCHWLH